MQLSLIEAFEQHFNYKPVLIARAPGRVNLLGAHVDYVDGFVLPGAINRVASLAVAPRDNGLVRVWSVNFDESASFSIATVQSPISDPTWLNYPMGVAWALLQNGRIPSGLDVVMKGNVPIGAGVSSSAAVEMAFLLAWEAVGDFALDNLTRAQLGQQTENEFLGVGSGMMDQFASVQGQANQFVLLDCRKLTFEMIPLPMDTAVILADSGVRRRLAQINYNSRPEECREAVALLKEYLPHVQTLRDVTREQLGEYGRFLPGHLQRRAQHAVGECARVLAGAEALKQSNIKEFGQLVQASQQSSRANYENSIPELDLLEASAKEVDGFYGARFGGGGFGGFMQVLCEKTAVPAIQAGMERAFVAEYGRQPHMFTCQISDGASVEWLK